MRFRGPTRQACGADITANCRGVNLDSNRLKECLSRNRDVISPTCKESYFSTLDAIQKRIAARVTVANACTREIVKVCGGSTKETSKSVPCLVAAKGLSRNCSQAINDAGYQMRASRRGLRDLGLLGTLVLLAMPLAPAHAQTVTRATSSPSGYFETAEIDVPALRQQVLERSRSRSKNELPPQSGRSPRPEQAASSNADILTSTR